MSAGREAVLVVAACAVLYLTGSGGIPFYTRGEPREGLVVREMLRTGAWLVPTRPEGETARKPPLYYWTAALALAAMPHRAERALRLPSAVFGTAAVVGVWATARAVWGAPAGLPAALVLATAFEWTRAATSARVDLVLAAALTALLAGWTLVLARGGAGATVLAALGAAAGALAKGPVALVLPALAALVLALARRDLGLIRRLRVAPVLGAAALAAGAWYGVALARQGGALLDVVVRENWLRFVDTEAAGTGHAHPAGYLILLGLVGLLPWTPLLPLALVPLRARPRPPAAALAAAWAVAVLLFFSLAAAKRSVYLLPLFPAVALLVGAGVADAPPAGRIAATARAAAWAYLPAAFVLAAVGAAFALGIDPSAAVRPWLKPDDAAGAAALAASARSAAGPLAVLGLATIAAAAVLVRAIDRAAWRRVVLTVATLAVAWTAAFDGLLHPAVARTRSLAEFMERVDRLVPPDAPLYAFFPPDPGLRFYVPRELRRWPPEGASAPTHVLVWEDERQRLLDRTYWVRELAASEARQTGRGRLLLVVVPPEGAGLRTGSRPP